MNEKRPNIVVLVFDELSLMDMLDADGRINAKLFPNFAKLAEDSIWFPNAYAVTPQTHLNVPSIFTGMLPSKSNLPPTYQNHPLNITELLKPRGYNIYAKEVCTNLFPIHTFQANRFIEDVSIIFCNVILPPVITSKMNIPSVSHGWSGFADNSAVDTAGELDLRSKKDYETKINGLFKSIDYRNKFFLFYHFLLPHWPYSYLNDGSLSNLGQYGFKDDVTPLPEDRNIVNMVKMQYLQQACYADLVLGKFTEKMKENNIYDDSVLIVLSDHGILNEPGKARRVIKKDNIPLDIASVVALMKIPGEKSAVVHDFMRHADVMPTLMDFLNWDIPWETDGKSLMANVKGSEEDDLLFFGINMKGEYVMKQEEFLERYKVRLKEKLKVFSSDYKNASEIHFTDPYHLSGCYVSAYQQVAPQENMAIIENAHFYQNVDYEKKFFPVFIKGKMAAENVLPVAFALNGKIYYVGSLFKDNKNTDAYEFVGYVPPAAFVEGYNKIELFMPVNRNGQIYLSPIKIKGSSAHLTSYGTIQYNEKEIKISDLDRVQGNVDMYSTGNNILKLTGWAIDSSKVSCVDEVLLFVGTEAVASSYPDQSRADVAAFFNEARYKYSGFSFMLPNNSVEDLRNTRVFAISGDIAKELPLPADLFTKIFTDNDPVFISKAGILHWQGQEYKPCSSGEDIKGFLDNSKLDHEQLLISGWAIDVTNKKPVDGVIVFVNNVPTAWQVTYYPRPDIAKAFNNKAYRKSGFLIQVPLSSINVGKDTSNVDVKVYALSSGRYSMLKVAGEK